MLDINTDTEKPHMEENFPGLIFLTSLCNYFILHTKGLNQAAAVFSLYYLANLIK